MKRTVLAVILLGLLVVLAAPGTSAAAEPCWKKVIADWYDNGIIDGKYPVPCLQAALRNLPEDVRDYTPLGDEIAAAIQAATGRKPSTPSSGGGNPGVGGNPSVGTPHPSATGPPRKPTHAPPTKLYKRSLGDGRIEQGSSVPTPLLILAGLGVLLLAAAAAQRYAPPLWRRRPRRSVRPST